MVKNKIYFFLYIAICFRNIYPTKITIIDKEPTDVSLSNSSAQGGFGLGQGLKFTVKIVKTNSKGVEEDVTLGVDDVEYMARNLVIYPYINFASEEEARFRATANKGKNESSQWIGFSDTMYVFTRSPLGKILAYKINHTDGPMKELKEYKINEDIENFDKINIKMMSTTQTSSPKIRFAYMDEEKIIAFHFDDTKVKKYDVVNFKLQNLSNVKDFTFQDENIEILMPNKVINFKYESNQIDKYIQGSPPPKTDGDGVNERTDLNMLNFWRIAIPSASDTVTKVRVLVNGIKELTFLEDWEDNSPSTLYDSLYKPQPIRCQSGEIVLKTTTDKSNFYTFYVLKDKETFSKISSNRNLQYNNRVLQTAAERIKSFEKFFLKGDYSDCFVTKNFVAFWGKSNSDSPDVSPRIVYFGSQGAIGFYLSDLKPEFPKSWLEKQNNPENDKTGEIKQNNQLISWDSVTKNINCIHITNDFIFVTGISRNFELVTYKLSMTNVMVKARVDPEKVILIPKTIQHSIKFISEGIKTQSQRILSSSQILNLEWQKKVNTLGWIVWGAGGTFFISFLILVILSLFKKNGQRRAEHMRGPTLIAQGNVMGELPTKEEIERFKRMRELNLQNDMMNARKNVESDPKLAKRMSIRGINQKMLKNLNIKQEENMVSVKKRNFDFIQEEEESDSETVSENNSDY